MLSTQVKVWVGPDACLCTVVSVELNNEQRIVFGLYYRKSELLFSELLTAEQQPHGMVHDHLTKVPSYMWQPHKPDSPPTSATSQTLAKFDSGALPIKSILGQATDASDRFLVRQLSQYVPITESLPDHNAGVTEWLQGRQLSLIIHEWNFYSDKLGRAAQVRMFDALQRMPVTLLGLGAGAAAPRTRMIHSSFQLGLVGAVPTTGGIASLGQPPLWWRAQPVLWDANARCCQPFRTLHTSPCPPKVKQI